MLDGSAGPSYTRAGNFSFDSSGTLVTSRRPEGPGLHDDRSGDQAGRHDAVRRPTITVPPGVLRAPVATTQFSMLTNLDASATRRCDVHVVDPDLRLARRVARRDDDLHEDRPGRVDLRPDAPMAPTSPAAPPARRSRSATGTLGFDCDRRADRRRRRGAGQRERSRRRPGATARQPAPLSWQVLDANNAPVLTGFSSPSATSSITQNGAAASTVQNIVVNPDGIDRRRRAAVRRRSSRSWRWRPSTTRRA